MTPGPLHAVAFVDSELVGEIALILQGPGSDTARGLDIVRQLGTSTCFDLVRNRQR